MVKLHLEQLSFRSAQQQNNLQFKMKIFIQLVSCFLAVYAATFVDPNQIKWQEFKAKFGKTYKTQQEEEFRMKIFMETQTSIAEHNAKYERGEVTYKMGINKFSDMPYDEFVNFYTGFKYPETPDIKTPETIASFPDDIPVPDYVNWTEKGAVTRVRYQGLCGSCYAFSAAGAMEGQHFIKTGKLVAVSEQNIVDCSTNFGNRGCFGGLMNNVFKYVIANKGIDSDASYPYEGFEMKCRFKSEDVAATFSSFKELPTGDEYALEKAVATIGPISVAVDAYPFISYDSGVFNYPKCSRTALNHGVLVVGYGTDNTTQEQYWLVKNSWGADWGENGYIRIAKNASNMCGIATHASYPIV